MKKSKVNGISVNLFQEDDIIEKLGRTKEEWNLVSLYQKKFWQLLQDKEGFCVDARMLWEELGRPQGKFADWIKRKVITKGFIEDKDYSSIRKIEKRDNGGNYSNEFNLTIECAKHVALMENTNIGRLVRNYFILMEKVVREYEKWLETREPQKQGNNIMKEAIKNTYQNVNNKLPKFYVYSNENDLLNECLTGMKAKQLQQYLDMKDKNTREHFTERVNSALAQLQFLNTCLINSGLDSSQRKLIIQDTVNMSFSDIILEIEKVKQNKVS